MAPAMATCLPKTYGPVVRLWVLRLIQLGGGVMTERRQRADLGQEALEAAGLQPCEQWQMREDKNFGTRAEAAFRRALEAAEARAATLPARSALSRNLGWLGEAAGLSRADLAILHFVAVSFHHPGLENALEQLGGLSLGSLQGMLARVLDLPVKDVARSLDPAGRLARTGLLQVDVTRNYTFTSKVEMIAGLGDRLTFRCSTPASLFRGAFIPGAEAELGLGHFPHLQQQLAILRPYLQSALEQRSKGVNILIHGRPGTGKTQLVRALARELGAELFEVAAQRSNGEPVEGNDRFRGYCLAQAVVGRHPKHLIFFDEIEDVFRPREDHGPSGRSNVSGVKAWVNKTLEENPAPAFWVTNQLPGDLHRLHQPHGPPGRGRHAPVRPQGTLRFPPGGPGLGDVPGCGEGPGDCRGRGREAGAAGTEGPDPGGLRHRRAAGPPEPAPGCPGGPRASGSGVPAQAVPGAEGDRVHGQGGREAALTGCRDGPAEGMTPGGPARVEGAGLVEVDRL